MIITKKSFDHKKHHEGYSTYNFHRSVDAEKYRLHPEYARSVSDIMKRYAVGITDNFTNNGSPDVAVNSSDLPGYVSDQILNNRFDYMSANVIDTVDVHNLVKEASEARSVRSGARVSESVTVNSNTEKTLTQE